MFANVNSEVYTYTYNADGIRTAKTMLDTGGGLIGSSEYIYDGTKLIAENRDGTWLYYFYDADGTVTGMSYNGTLYYYRKNLQGDITGIYNASGNIIAQYEYTPYGAPLTITNGSGTDVSTNATHIANINPFRYRGYYYDTETGFYYLQTRYYDPEAGRFLNADAYASTGQGIIGNNMFAYCNNCPINNYDPTGLCYTPSDIKTCLKGANCCDHNHCTADYIGIRSLRDVSQEIDKALYEVAAKVEQEREIVFHVGLLSVIAINLKMTYDFYKMVDHGGPWDIKLSDSWEKTIGPDFPGKDKYVLYHGIPMTPENLGNFTYGYIGAAYGFKLTVLYGGSYYAAGFPTEKEDLKNEVNDLTFVTLGFSYYFLNKT